MSISPSSENRMFGYVGGAASTWSENTNLLKATASGLVVKSGTQDVNSLYRATGRSEDSIKRNTMRPFCKRFRVVVIYVNCIDNV